MNEQDLIVRLRQGDETAFQYLFEEYYVGLCVYARRFIRDRDAVEELVQDTFMKLWKKKEHQLITDSLRAYLYRAVQNQCLNYLKHQRVVNKHIQSVNDQLKAAGDFLLLSQENGHSVYLAKELEHKIMQAIEQLPPACREIFKLNRLEGMKYEEIARQQGVTINTVQKQISIALAKLRILLSEYLPLLPLIAAHSTLFTNLP